MLLVARITINEMITPQQCSGLYPRSPYPLDHGGCSAT
jgi:hypothetical protein